MNVDQLKQELAKRNLPTHGLKPALVEQRYRKTTSHRTGWSKNSDRASSRSPGRGLPCAWTELEAARAEESSANKSSSGGGQFTEAGRAGWKEGGWCSGWWVSHSSEEGELFTFGVENYGQLGHRGDENELVPSLVEALMEA